MYGGWGCVAQQHTVEDLAWHSVHHSSVQRTALRGGSLSTCTSTCPCLCGSLLGGEVCEQHGVRVHVLHEYWAVAYQKRERELLRYGTNWKERERLNCLRTEDWEEDETNRKEELWTWIWSGGKWRDVQWSDSRSDDLSANIEVKQLTPVFPLLLRSTVPYQLCYIYILCLHVTYLWLCIVCRWRHQRKGSSQQRVGRGSGLTTRESRYLRLKSELLILLVEIVQITHATMFISSYIKWLRDDQLNEVGKCTGMSYMNPWLIMKIDRYILFLITSLHLISCYFVLPISIYLFFFFPFDNKPRTSFSNITYYSKIRFLTM